MTLRVNVSAALPLPPSCISARDSRDSRAGRQVPARTWTLFSFSQSGSAIAVAEVNRKEARHKPIKQRNAGPLLFAHHVEIFALPAVEFHLLVFHQSFCRFFAAATIKHDTKRNHVKNVIRRVLQEYRNDAAIRRHPFSTVLIFPDAIGLSSRSFNFN